MVDARIQFGLQNPDILSSLTRGIDLAQQLKNAPILDRLLKQRETQGQQNLEQGEQNLRQGEQEITQAEQDQALQGIQLQGRVGTALLGMDDIEDRRAFLIQVAPVLIKAGIDPEDIRSFPIDDDERIRAVVDQAQSLFPQKTIGSPVIGQLEGGGFGFASLTPSGGRVTPVKGFTPTGSGGETPSQKESRRAREFQEKQGTRLETEPDIASATVTAKGKAEKTLVDAANAETRIASFDNNVFKAQNGLDVANDALALVSGLTTGAIGSLLKAAPGTEAFELNSLIDTLLANLSFKELSDMRKESTSGGALGAINTRELQLLGATLTSLSQGLSPSALRKNLQKVANSYGRVLDNLSKMREADVKTLGTDPSVIRFDDQGNIVQ